MWQYIQYVLSAALTLGFGTIGIISCVVLSRQKKIIVESRLGKSSSVSEIINVNIALVGIAMSVWFHYYIFIPPLLMYIFFIVITTRIRSGLSEEGMFVGLTFIDWEHIEGYKFVNDNINTIKVKLRANKRQYIIECDKEQKADVEQLVRGKLQEIPER
ncbi:MAG: hypothetical protein J6K43_16375 [Lachnospiraceae bacterium]|nr:hypothetical protein [Lachnospiraceae bacterium]